MISIEKLRLKAGTFELRGVDLAVETGQYCVLIGPTGSGKTLLMECVAGLRKTSGGAIRLGGRDATALPPELRGVGYVPQDWALFPFMKVIDNITIGFKLKKIGETKARESLDRIVSMLDIGSLLERSPVSLSGGERQRVALARALAVDPDFLLLDEPYSSLDSGTRRQLGNHMFQLHRQVRKTVLHITHDLEEAFSLGESIAVLIDGKIEQSGSREEVFYRPRNRAVASFLDIQNILSGKATALDRGSGKMTVRCRDYDVVVPLKEGVKEGSEISFCISPQDVKIIRGQRPIREELLDNLFAGRIVRIISHGLTHTLHFRITASRCSCGDYDFELKVPNYSFVKLGLAEGKEIQVSLRRKAIHVFEIL